MNNVEKILLDLERKHLVDRSQLADKLGVTRQTIHGWVARNKISKKGRMLLLTDYNIDFRDYKDGVYVEKHVPIDLDKIEKHVDKMILEKIAEIEKLLKTQSDTINSNANTINTQAETIKKLLEKS